jgi:putative addiction module killer protein
MATIPKRLNLRTPPICAIVEKKRFEGSFQILFYQTANEREPFSDWLDSLDGSVQSHVTARIDRVERGLMGDAKSLKDGLYEFRFKNPAFRIYFAVIEHQKILVILGGTKGRQSNDIVKAKEYLIDYRSRYAPLKEES